MTNSEAIKTMEYFDRNFGDYEPNHEAIQMAIEALEVGHAQCNDCHYRYHWMTQRMNGQNGGATA